MIIVLLGSFLFYISNLINFRYFVNREVVEIFKLFTTRALCAILISYFCIIEFQEFGFAVVYLISNLIYLIYTILKKKTKNLIKREKFKKIDKEKIVYIFLLLFTLLTQFYTHNQETLGWDVNTFIVMSQDILKETYRMKIILIIRVQYFTFYMLFLRIFKT